MDPWLWLGLFILLAYTVEAATGFGSIVIALSLGALFLPIAELLPVLVPLNLALSGYLGIRQRAHIHWPTLLQSILPLMALGTLLGYLLKPTLGSTTLQVLFGILIACFAGRELWRLRPTATAAAAVAAPAKTRGLMLAAGTTHGLFASGGPLLVYALAGTSLDKAKLRATLIAVWFSLNSLLTLIYLFDGSLLPSLPRLWHYLPIVVVGIIVGDWLHRRINEQQFRRLVFALLAIIGTILALSA